MNLFFALCILLSSKTRSIEYENIPMFKNLYDFPVGFSDHSTGIVSSVIAVTLGAKVIEKHITLDKSYPGPDHPFALNQAK